MDPEPARPLSALPAALEAERLNDEALDESLADILAEGPIDGTIRLFAYGSLMWNPEVSYDTHHVATLYGYHRNFCLWSRINRGTPQQPGLVLTLERGGSARVVLVGGVVQALLAWRAGRPFLQVLGPLVFRGQG